MDFSTIIKLSFNVFCLAGFFHISFLLLIAKKFFQDVGNFSKS